MGTSASTRNLVLAASALGGILAGANADRFIVGRHAWRRVGVESWAAYSRNADLSVTGALFYPTLAIGGAFSSIGAVFGLRRDRQAPRRAALPLSLAALFAIGGLLVTTQAAPNMLSVRRLGQDRAALQKAFDRFYGWSTLRAACQIAAFATNLWSLAALR